MALYDQNLTFFKLPTGQPVTATAVTELTYDILQGLMIDTATGTYPVDSDLAIIGRLRPQTTPRTKFWGEDLGPGRGMGDPTVDVYIDPSATPAGGTNINVLLLGAPDNGSGTIAGLTFTPFIEDTGGGIPLAQIIANLAVGWNQLCEFDLPRRPTGFPLPRFLQLQYLLAGAWTGLNLKGYIGLGDTSAEDTLGQYPANF